MTHQNTIQKLHPGGYYHIYNRGNNRETIFKEPANYAYFLTLWEKYIEPVAQTFCYNLLPNHFHFFIRVREVPQICETCETLQPGKPIEQHFSNLFNAYAKAINKRYNRTGSLFQERFRRKEIDSDDYRTTIIGYIITNAVKHGYCTNVEAYPWSAYHNLVSDKPTGLLRDELTQWFGNRMAFINYIKNYTNEITGWGNFLEHENDDN
ncbi:transposase [Agriterribacter sp.]|uniref:transposase n=1 Tax=Agriterribacter sp. TaxID=2821509 RepID=UPI002BC68F5C|nr:transposase [Agriterribacter sp.]HRO47107.1 transposase [Agriterribacter sp.]HRQ17864.1 transposase [Agriterribacter sp.]